MTETIIVDLQAPAASGPDELKSGIQGASEFWQTIFQFLAWSNQGLLATEPRAVGRRGTLPELGSIASRLLEVLRPEAASTWLATPHNDLDNRRPLDLIMAGEGDRVAQLVSELEVPSFT
jgi:hypothetical protein